MTPDAQDRFLRWLTPGVLGALALTATLTARAQSDPPKISLDELVSSVVQIKTFINPDGRTIGNLGRERQGSAVVIDDSGLVLTIGYLMVEAHAAEVRTNSGRHLPANVVGYDHETGFGLLRTIEPLKLKPIAFGRSSDLKVNDPVLVAGHGGVEMLAAARVVSKREFAGSWEYLLDEAIFTSPPHPAWSGAALISREGKLVGIGSLIVGDASGGREKMPGNMFVPIDRLPPILGDLIADGRISSLGHPWLGVTTEDVQGRLLVSAVTPGGPAEKAGVQRGSIIIGVAGEKATSLADFYRKVWARGTAGAVVPVDIQRNHEVRRVDITSMNRLDHLKLKSSF